MAWIRRRVRSATLAWLFKAKDTVAVLTPHALATACLLLGFGFNSLPSLLSRHGLDLTISDNQ